jgi:hypothetical protein
MGEEDVAAGRRGPRWPLIAAGYITAIALPIIGFAIGFLILLRRRTVHGTAIVLISVATVFTALTIVSNDDDGGNTSPEVQRQYRRIKGCLGAKLGRLGVNAALNACEEKTLR